MLVTFLGHPVYLNNYKHTHMQQANTQTHTDMKANTKRNKHTGMKAHIYNTCKHTQVHTNTQGSPHGRDLSIINSITLGAKMHKAHVSQLKLISAKEHCTCALR